MTDCRLKLPFVSKNGAYTLCRAASAFKNDSVFTAGPQNTRQSVPALSSLFSRARRRGAGRPCRTVGRVHVCSAQ